MSETENENASGETAAAVVEATALMEELLKHKSSFESQMASAISNASQLLEQGKKDLSEIGNLKTEIATSKGAIEASQQTAAADIGIIQQQKADVASLRSSIDTILGTANAAYDEITKRISELSEKHDALQSLVGDVTKLRDLAATNSDGIEADVQKISEAKKRFSDFSAQATAEYEKLVSAYKAANEQTTQVGTWHEEVGAFHETIFLDEKDKKGIKLQIEDLKEQVEGILSDLTARQGLAVTDMAAFEAASKEGLEKFRESLNNQFQDLHHNLEARILSLLPTAGAAGLASTYYDAKSRYARTRAKGKLDSAGREGAVPWFGKVFGYDPSSIFATFFFYLLFLLPIGVIVVLFAEFLAKLATVHPPAIDPKILILRTLIALPLATVSFFGFSSLRLNRRLYEEYNHKQRVMELYNSFSREIDVSGDPEQKKALLTLMLKAVADKPSLAMNRYDGSGKDTVRIDWIGLMNKFVGTK